MWGTGHSQFSSWHTWLGFSKGLRRCAVWGERCADDGDEVGDFRLRVRFPGSERRSGVVSMDRLDIIREGLR